MARTFRSEFFLFGSGPHAIAPLGTLQKCPFILVERHVSAAKESFCSLSSSRFSAFYLERATLTSKSAWCNPFTEQAKWPTRLKHLAAMYSDGLIRIARRSLIDNEKTLWLDRLNGLSIYSHNYKHLLTTDIRIFSHLLREEQYHILKDLSAIMPDPLLSSLCTIWSVKLLNFKRHSSLTIYPFKPCPPSQIPLSPLLHPHLLPSLHQTP